MKRKVLSLLICGAMMSTILTACGGNKTVEKVDDNTVSVVETENVQTTESTSNATILDEIIPGVTEGKDANYYCHDNNIVIGGNQHIEEFGGVVCYFDYGSGYREYREAYPEGEEPEIDEKVYEVRARYLFKDEKSYKKGYKDITNYCEKYNKKYKDTTKMKVEVDSDDSNYYMGSYHLNLYITIYSKDYIEKNKSRLENWLNLPDVQAIDGSEEVYEYETDAPAVTKDNSDVREYMSSEFSGRYPDIKAKLKNYGYDADNLQCRLIWSDFERNPRLIFENKDGGVNSLIFSWQDIDCVDYYEYDQAYSVNDCEYYSVEDAYDGYVNEIRIPHIYESWTFAKPALEEYLAQYYNDGDSSVYMYKIVSASTVLGEDGFTVAMYDTRYDTDGVIGIMWNWNDGTVTDARECRYMFKSSDFEYNTLQEAFDGYCREYW